MVYFFYINRPIYYFPNEVLVKDASVWGFIFFAVAVESFTDGLMIGTGVLIAITLGLLLSLGQATADIPMGFVNISSFKEKRFLLKRNF